MKVLVFETRCDISKGTSYVPEVLALIIVMSSSQLAKDDEFLVRTSINSILLRFMLFSTSNLIFLLT